MSLPDFHKDYFQLFDLPAGFALDGAHLGECYRKLQGQLHPDRYASQSPQEQRLAVQYSALVNEAYATLKSPLSRALYLLELAGMSNEEVAAQHVDGGFLIMQMELREKLESVPGLVDPDPVLDHVLAEIEDQNAMGWHHHAPEWSDLRERKAWRSKHTGKDVQRWRFVVGSADRHAFGVYLSNMEYIYSEGLLLGI